MTCLHKWLNKKAKQSPVCCTEISLMWCVRQESTCVPSFHRCHTAPRWAQPALGNAASPNCVESSPLLPPKLPGETTHGGTNPAGISPDTQGLWPRSWCCSAWRWEGGSGVSREHGGTTSSGGTDPILLTSLLERLSHWREAQQGGDKKATKWRPPSDQSHRLKRGHQCPAGSIDQLQSYTAVEKEIFSNHPCIFALDLIAFSSVV